MHDTIIIGIGPAGLSAAIYCSRAGLKTILIGEQKKSSLRKAAAIENYFGITSSSGKNILSTGIKQAERFGTTIVEDEVVNIKQAENEFIVKTSKGKQHSGKTIIFATGIPACNSGIQNEEKLTGRGVHYCAVCDGFFYKNKKIAVVGNGNFAAEQAIELMAYTKDVSIISNGKKFEINKKYSEALKKNRIKLIDTKINSFEGGKKLERIKTAHGDLKFDGVFMGIGCSAMSFAQRFGIETKGNSIVVDNAGKTNVPGIYAAGACTGAISQVSVAVGEGCKAAISVIKQIRGKAEYMDYGKK